ncbi:MAG: hypothetical protein J7L51_02275 [Desulfurococcales archaeon]|nr:hypothetical protein [Desulfurococcales archaeon]
MRYRCWHDIVESLPETLVTGKKGITELCAVTNTPVDRGKKLVEWLVEYGLIAELAIEGKRYYRIAARGTSG